MDDDYEQQLDDFMRFTGNKPTTGKIAFFLVMGMTGAGKSTLIQQCTGRKVQIGHGLRSCTNDLSVHSFQHNGYHVHMIDTPGFDDTNRSDIDTLKSITTYLSASFANGVRINGIIYLHRISDNRFGGTGLRNLRMFKKLTGTGSWANTAIGTTMWSTAQYTEHLAREAELENDAEFFGDLISNGARLFRVSGGTEPERKSSALRIVTHLLQQMRNSPSVQLDIQREIVSDRLTLDATKAGKEVLGDVAVLRSQMTQQLQSLQEDMAESLRARDAESWRQLRRMEESISKTLTDSVQKQKEMKASLQQVHDEEVERLLARVKKTEAMHEELLKKKRAELDDLKESHRLMLEQAAEEEARWRRQALHQAEQARKQRLNKEIERECEREIRALKAAVEREERKLKAVEKARAAIDLKASTRVKPGVNPESAVGASPAEQKKAAMKGNVVNGLTNGVAAGAVATIAPLVLGAMCIMS